MQRETYYVFHTDLVLGDPLFHISAELRVVFENLPDIEVPAGALTEAELLRTPGGEEALALWRADDHRTLELVNAAEDLASRADEIAVERCRGLSEEDAERWRKAHAEVRKAHRETSDALQEVG